MTITPSKKQENNKTMATLHRYAYLPQRLVPGFASPLGIDAVIAIASAFFALALSAIVWTESSNVRTASRRDVVSYVIYTGTVCILEVNSVLERP